MKTEEKTSLRGREEMKTSPKASRDTDPLNGPILPIRCFPAWSACRLRTIMSTTNPCKYMINQQHTKTGNLLFLGENYLAKNPKSIPLCLKKTGVYPIYGPILRLLSHFEKGWLRQPSEVLYG
jgi:hypothetical protein